MEDRLYDMDSRFAPKDVQCLIGDVYSGRTGALIEHARVRAAAGERVLFVCTNEPALERVSVEFASQAGGSSDGRVRVCRPVDVALQVLSTPQALAMFGRAPRVLDGYEQDILMEDMKVSQMKNRRLRALSGYLFSGWANLSDDRWEQTYEEDLFIERLHSNLRLIGGVLPCEASNLALKVLREHEDVRRDLSYDLVIVDDFELASRSTQHMLRALSRAGFRVASALRPGPAAPGEPDPCYLGAVELIEAVPDVAVDVMRATCRPPKLASALSRLSRDGALPSLAPAGLAKIAEAGGAGGAAAAAVAADVAEAGEVRAAPAVPASSGAGADPSDDSFSVCMAHGPEEELLVMANAAADALSQGLSVMIVGADKLWRRNVAANFARVGLPVAEDRADHLRGRNLEDPKVAGRIECASLKRLVKDAHDGVSWRALLAAGDHVGRSAAVDKLRTAAAAAAGDEGGFGPRLLDALELLRAGKLDIADIDRPIMDDLLAAYERAVKLLEAAKEDSREGDFEGNSAAAAATAAAEPAGASGIAEARDPGLIFLCSLDDVAGRSADAVILGGFVNGAVPCRAYFDPTGLAGGARERERTRCVRSLHGVAQAARTRLLITGFTQVNLQIAETMDLHIASIKLKGGVRMAAIEPSELLGLLEEG